jgi:hypothetical protein
MKPENCLDCKFHKIILDPDPDDWFCDDDLAVVCTNKAAPTNDRFDLTSRYEADKQSLKPITVSCRPHHVRKESKTPKWCPLPVQA